MKNGFCDFKYFADQKHVFRTVCRTLKTKKEHYATITDAKIYASKNLIFLLENVMRLCCPFLKIQNDPKSHRQKINIYLLVEVF
jgi:hypothetical protein